MPWPRAIQAPACLLEYPLATVAAKTGPGITTPDREMNTTNSKKIGRLPSIIEAILTNTGPVSNGKGPLEGAFKGTRRPGFLLASKFVSAVKHHESLLQIQISIRRLL